ncbi:KIF-binding protein [Phlebotomus argentipes]|uniref:KIF-binding protein n=1 Tax=Phlebotomus argentipes TaxID=94469 RepID=UPI002893757C|nr:KIF-binding protein [Phlebotomus argentipes]
MPVDKEKLQELKGRYDKAVALMEKESKSDPETDPFRSHYAARDILLEIRAGLEKLVIGTEEADGETRLIYRFLLGIIYKTLGQLYIFVEESGSARKYLQDCILSLEDVQTHPDAVIPLVGALNQLGILQANQNEPKEARETLLRAEKIYNDYNATESAEPLTTINDLFATKEEIESGAGRLLLEKTHTLTLYYLAQVVCTLGETDNSRTYCHNTLKRQLQFNDYEHIDWALNAVTLSQCFLTPDGLTHARHHLAAATFMMDKFEAVMLKPEMTEEEKAAQLETLRHRNADVSRCWVKYALYILTHSKERLMEDKEEDEKSDEEKRMKSLKLNDDGMTFALDLSLYETKITDQPVLMFEDAKEVYLFALGHINRAKDYYRADTLASEYAKVIMDLSSMLKYLAFFEENEDDQCKLHKKQADHLEDLVAQLNPTYYLVICREVWYELGITYMTMLDIKLDKLKHNDRPSPHALNKVNTLCDKGIKNFDKFRESFPKIDDTTPDEDMQLILYAYFHLGRLYYKKITPDKRMQFVNLENSLKFYNLFLTGCDRREALTKGMKGEIGCCREMVRLLPLKLAQINIAIGSS